MLCLDDLFVCLDSLIDGTLQGDYLGIYEEIRGMEGLTLHVIPRKNFKMAKSYCEHSFNENLTFKSYAGIRIVGWATGSLEDISHNFTEARKLNEGPDEIVDDLHGWKKNFLQRFFSKI